MDLEQRLAAAKARMEAASTALRGEHHGGEREEFNAAIRALRVAERELAAANHEEHAVPLDFPVRWDFTERMPQLVMNDHRTFLIFSVSIRDPTWDGSHVVITDPAHEHEQPLALVEFRRCISARLGTPNDEVHAGHPLDGKGLESFTPQLVRHSRWLAELEKINSVHNCYRPETWAPRNHYVFWFHDSTFEC